MLFYRNGNFLTINFHQLFVIFVDFLWNVVVPKLCPQRIVLGYLEVIFWEVTSGYGHRFLSTSQMLLTLLFAVMSIMNFQRPI